MVAFFGTLLINLWDSWKRNGLLDDGDIELLKDCCEGVLERNQIQGLFNIGFSLILLIGTIIYRPFFWFAVVPFLCMLTFEIIIWPIFCQIPILFAKYWINFDNKFNSYLSLLREKEICLFSLQPSNHRNSSSSTLPFRQSRLNYLKCLRNYIETYHSASQSICSTKDDANKLFINFIGPEMHSLIYEKYDGCEREEQTFLSITALKSLWQCMFLVRSEFLRLFLLNIQQNILLFQPFEFFKNIFILFKTFWRTFNYLDLFNQREELIFKVKEVKPKEEKILKEKIGKWKSLSDFAICKAQLEFILESFNNNSFEQETEQISEQFALNTISNLQLIINLLKQNIEKTSKELDKKLENKIEEALNEQETVTLSCETKNEEDDGEHEEDFQIFELDPKFTKIDSEGFEFADQNSEQSSSNSSLPFGSHKAITNELKNVLNERKEFCLKRECKALAKLRGVLPEEIEKEELDRKPFNFCKLTREEEKIVPKSFGAFGINSTAMDTNCLNEILEKRQAIFASKSEYMKMEEFGGDDETEEDDQ
uniref:Uncharacterized protein n=1 Tax=Meloidogyne enterolobii TaxID=390850 RepID=A0A6V7VDA8_MELEN|nr:unnamed protein product [Meloidogyne enterolobii]